MYMSTLHFNNATKIGILHMSYSICVYFEYDFSLINVIENLCLQGRFLIRVLF